MAPQNTSSQPASKQFQPKRARGLQFVTSFWESLVYKWPLLGSMKVSFRLSQRTVTDWFGPGASPRASSPIRERSLVHLGYMMTQVWGTRFASGRCTFFQQVPCSTCQGFQVTSETFSQNLPTGGHLIPPPTSSHRMSGTDMFRTGKTHAPCLVRVARQK